MTATIIQGDALERLRELPSDHFHCVVTSPPYWGLRDYGTGTWEGGDPACDHAGPPMRTNNKPTNANATFHGGTTRANQFYRDVCGKCGARRIDQQIGLEETPEEWCARLVEVFREVRRVLRPDGCCFVNVGDSYNNFRTQMGPGQAVHGRDKLNGKPAPLSRQRGAAPLKEKDLVGQPWLLAFALRADGCADWKAVQTIERVRREILDAYDDAPPDKVLAILERLDAEYREAKGNSWWLRGDYIWAKPNPMPESVRDRCTKAHEYVFHLSKSERYFWDAEAVREPHAGPLHAPGNLNVVQIKGNRDPGLDPDRVWGNPAGRNLRSVWTIATDPLPSIEVDGEKLDHFASYPIELARRCILAGTSAKGCCPECGAPWARVVVERPEYREYAEANVFYGPGGKGSAFRANGTNARATPAKNETTGWRPTCSHSHEPEPCRVLDCFGGSGRTALAAEELGRDSVLIELNPASVRMAHAQLERANARRFIGDAERAPVIDGQLTLFDVQPRNAGDAS